MATLWAFLSPIQWPVLSPRNLPTPHSSLHPTFKTCISRIMSDKMAGEAVSGVVANFHNFDPQGGGCVSPPLFPICI